MASAPEVPARVSGPEVPIKSSLLMASRGSSGGNSSAVGGIGEGDGKVFVRFYRCISLNVNSNHFTGFSRRKTHGS